MPGIASGNCSGETRFSVRGGDARTLWHCALRLIVVYAFRAIKDQPGVTPDRDGPEHQRMNRPHAGEHDKREQHEHDVSASIKPDTFKVRYGAFKLDITGRITAAPKVTAEGIDVAEAALPKGSHRLSIEIQELSAPIQI